MQGEDYPVMIREGGKRFQNRADVVFNFRSFSFFRHWILIIVQQILPSLFFSKLVYGLSDADTRQPFPEILNLVLSSVLPVLQEGIVHDLFSISTVSHNPQTCIIQPCGHGFVYFLYVNRVSHKVQFHI